MCTFFLASVKKPRKITQTDGPQDTSDDDEDGSDDDNDDDDLDDDKEDDDQEMEDEGNFECFRLFDWLIYMMVRTTA